MPDFVHADQEAASGAGPAGTGDRASVLAVLELEETIKQSSAGGRGRGS
ncbi:hypothetical protein ACFIN9_40720 [Streptomyces noursei]